MKNQRKHEYMIAMSSPFPLYKRTLFLLLLLFFSFSLIVITLDKHFNNYSPTCPKCRVKVSLNGTESFFVLKVPPSIAHFVLTETPGNFIIPILSPFQNKSPPKSFHVC